MARHPHGRVQNGSPDRRALGYLMPHNQWDRMCMMLRAQYRLTPAGLNRVLLSMETLGRGLAGLGTALAVNPNETEGETTNV